MFSTYPITFTGSSQKCGSMSVSPSRVRVGRPAAASTVYFAILRRSLDEFVHHGLQTEDVHDHHPALGYASGVPGGGLEAVRVAAFGKERLDREPVAGDPLRDVSQVCGGDQYIGGARTLTAFSPVARRSRSARPPSTQPAQAPPRRPATPAGSERPRPLSASCGPCPYLNPAARSRRARSLILTRRP